MGTLPAWWTEPYPEVSSPGSAADYLDALGAALNRRKEDGAWILATGEQELITTDTEEELDAFVLGFALAHLICERHGLIGQRSGPTRLPHPAEVEEAQAAPEERAATDDEGAADQAAPSGDQRDDDQEG